MDKFPCEVSELEAVPPATDATVAASPKSAICTAVDTSGSTAEESGHVPGRSLCEVNEDVVNVSAEEFFSLCRSRSAGVLKDLAYYREVTFDGHGVVEKLNGLPSELEQPPTPENPTGVPKISLSPYGPTPFCATLRDALRWGSELTVKDPEIQQVFIFVFDGRPSDGDPRELCKKLAASGAWTFFLHVSPVVAPAVVFPSSATELPNDPFCQLMFECSQPLPSLVHELALEAGVTPKDQQLTEESRGLVFNASPALLSAVLRLGSRTAITVSQVISGGDDF